MKNTFPMRKMLALVGALPLAMMTVVATPAPTFAQTAPATTNTVVVPPQGPTIDVETARKQLKDNMPTQIAEFLKLHNDARAEVGVGPLVWDAGLAAYAQEWADQLAAKGGNIEHRENLKVGENLSAYSSTGMRAVHGAKLWYDEIKDYNPTTNASINGNAVGHYTQMVWNKTTKVGFGVAMAPNGMIVLVANYDPAGNFNNLHPYKQ